MPPRGSEVEVTKPRSAHACRSVSDAQTKVIYAFSIGLSPHEVAAALNISPKTIHSHKKNIMSKFNLNSRQQFNNLVQLLAKR